jgi:diguanylate cyclase (GGDEF)-like protein
MLDLDHFKAINDSFGHQRGDQVLAAVGDLLSEEIRASDFVGRYGGEEFVVLLPHTGRAGGMELAEKLRDGIEGLCVRGLGRTLSASFGVAALPDDAGDPAELLRCADRALYAAKAAGRNRVVAFDRLAGAGVSASAGDSAGARDRVAQPPPSRP